MANVSSNRQWTAPTPPAFPRPRVEGREEIRKCVEIFKHTRRRLERRLPDRNRTRRSGSAKRGGFAAATYLTWETSDRTGAPFDDGITEIDSGSNIHPVDNPYEPRPQGLPAPPKFRVRPYQIPYRCLLATGVDNLLTAGRCISGDCYALGSYRLTGNVVRTGEAAGLAAAMAVRQRVAPPEVDGTALVARLSELRAESPPVG